MRFRFMLQLIGFPLVAASGGFWRFLAQPVFWVALLIDP